METGSTSRHKAGLHSWTDEPRSYRPFPHNHVKPSRYLESETSSPPFGFPTPCL
ncbi:hypothetical protein M378DRAFT_162736, partial [Amanita muscaria Koide BX008]